jgi:hypothetical protein
MCRNVMRNVLDKGTEQALPRGQVPQSRRADVAAALKTIWHQENAGEARHKAARVVEQFGKGLPAAMRTLTNNPSTGSILHRIVALSSRFLDLRSGA